MNRRIALLLLLCLGAVACTSNAAQWPVCQDPQFDNLVLYTVDGVDVTCKEVK